MTEIRCPLCDKVIKEWQPTKHDLFGAKVHAVCPKDKAPCPHCNLVHPGECD